MRVRTVPVPAYHYLTLIARAYANSGGEPTPPAVRCCFVTLYKHAVGVKVQAWFWRHNPRKVPELRIGINFDRWRAEHNEQAATAFLARHADELQALGAEYWPSETELDRRYMTRVEVPPVGEDLTAVTEQAVKLARRYVQLLRTRNQESGVRDQESGVSGTTADVSKTVEAP